MPPALTSASSRADCTVTLYTPRLQTDTSLFRDVACSSLDVPASRREKRRSQLSGRRTHFPPLSLLPFWVGREGAGGFIPLLPIYNNPSEHVEQRERKKTRA